MRKVVRRGPGRPKKTSHAEGERVRLSLRVTPKLKRMLDNASDNSGRSQSQEAEFRLEKSFDRVDLLQEVMTLAYAPEVAAVLRVYGRALSNLLMIHNSLAYMAKKPLKAGRALSTPYVYADAMKVLKIIIDRMPPKGDPTFPPEIERLQKGYFDVLGERDIAESVADHALTFLKEGSAEFDREWDVDVKALLRGFGGITSRRDDDTT